MLSTSTRTARNGTDLITTTRMEIEPNEFGHASSVLIDENQAAGWRIRSTKDVIAEIDGRACIRRRSVGTADGRSWTCVEIYVPWEDENTPPDYARPEYIDALIEAATALGLKGSVDDARKFLARTKGRGALPLKR